jgi:hypothetical protein
MQAERRGGCIYSSLFLSNQLLDLGTVDNKINEQATF